MYTYKLNIGDWSDDGHGECREVYFKSNLTDDEIRHCYFNAVDATGIGLHDPDSTQNPGRVMEKHTPILSDYKENEIPAWVVSHLTDCGVDLSGIGEESEKEEGGIRMHAEDVAKLFLEMVKADVASRGNMTFVYEIVNDATPNINGFWSKKLNSFLGYGVFT